MKNYRRLQKKFIKSIAVLTALSILTQAFYIPQAYAMTGPVAPEFSSFESVGTSGMVNEFTGDFSYNLPIIEIPGANGGGYAMSLTYNSNISPEDDASWVGYGFNLSPGAIVRGKQGFPDDVNAGAITRTNTNNIVSTIGLEVPAGVTLEGFTMQASLGINNILQYNNQTGFSYQAIPYAGFSALDGSLSLSAQYVDGNCSFDAAIHPMSMLAYGIDHIGVPSALATGNMKAAVKFTDAANNVRSTQQKLRSFTSNSGIGLSNFANRSLYSSGSISGIQTCEGVKLEGEIEAGVSPFPVPFSVDQKLSASVSVQVAKNSQSFLCYGYLHSHEAIANVEGKDMVLMDYNVERDDAYSKKEYFLAVPYSQPDQFSVMGEGIGGSFKAHAKKLGYYHRNRATNGYVPASFGIDLAAGTDLLVGGNVSAGSVFNMFSTWDETEADYAYDATLDEPYAFIFSGDLGSYISFGSDEADNADLTSTSFSSSDAGIEFSEQWSSLMVDVVSAIDLPGIAPDFYEPELPSSISATVNTYNATELNNLDESTGRIPRTSYVGYHTNEEMLMIDGDGISYNRYTSSDYDNLVGVNRGERDGIGEFFITNNSGNRYVYGIPVYNKNETNYSFILTPEAYDSDIITNRDGDVAPKDYWVAASLSTDIIKSEMGEVNSYEYASSWLLNEITTSDYIDRTMNGPTDDDFGGWTKFDYTKLYGTDGTVSDDYYHYRRPYNGYINNLGSLSSDKDNSLSFSSGEREVYYLKNIETKTHIAEFTISSDREDGYDAYYNDKTAGSSFEQMGTHSLRKLEKITLYVKDDNNDDLSDNLIIKTVHFDYDYSLMPNHPSNINGRGVLTLKKVWTEYAGVVNEKISPIEFVYSYADGDTYPAVNGYDNLDDYNNYATLSATAISAGSEDPQNPSYSLNNADRWGFYQANGETRYNELKPWVNQIPADDFDPAAYTLKQIKLPSGGEIHLQYEQDEYQYVQDQRAHAMVSIMPDAEVSGVKDDKYYLNLEEIGIDTDDAEKIAEVMDLIQKNYIDAGSKIYAKFLYHLNGLASDGGGIGTCPAEYVEFYANVTNVDSDGTGVYITLGTNNENDYSYPRQVCVDFMNATRSGIISTTSCATGSDIADINESVTGDGAISLLYELLAKMGETFVVDDESCMSIDEAYSYFRIPMPSAKKGGGLRVKRLLTFDDGMNNEIGDEVLYGTEYIYEKADGTSSGVASNEPALGGDENILVVYLDAQRDNTMLEKIVAGVDKKQFEGPIGECVLPGPSVGYSRVVSKNIFEGKTNTGFSVNDFFTTKDYPFNGTWTYTDPETGSTKTVKGVDYTDIKQESQNADIAQILLTFYSTGIWNTQGYSFIQNDMNGKPRKQSVYSGNYADISQANLASQVEYDYYQPGEPVKVADAAWDWNPTTGTHDAPHYRTIGKEMEVTMESRYVMDANISAAVTFDASVGILGVPPFFIPFGIALANVSGNFDQLATHVINKTTFYPAMLKSVRKYVDGITSYTNNEVFNGVSGEAMVTKTYDAYDGIMDMAPYGETAAIPTPHNGTYTSYNFPASHYYPALGRKGLYDNRTLYYGENGISYGKVTNSGSYAYALTATGDLCSGLINPGDLIALWQHTDDTHSGEGYIELYYVGEIDGNTIEILPTVDYYYSGNVFAEVDIKVVRSAKTNQLGASVGNLVTYGETPVATIHTVEEQVIADQEGAWANREYLVSEMNDDLAQINSSDYLYTQAFIRQENADIGDGCSLELFSVSQILVGDYITINTLTASEKGCGVELLYNSSYLYYLDDKTGEIMYGDESIDCGTKIECINFCPDFTEYFELDNVVAASAITLSDEWKLREEMSEEFDFATNDLMNDYENGSKGKWRQVKSYDYNTTLTNATDANNHVYGAGIYNNFIGFDWLNESANTEHGWTVLNTSDEYSPNGVLMTETNPLNISSLMKTVNNHNLPGLVASNVHSYKNVTHEGFEVYENNAGVYEYESEMSIASLSAMPNQDFAHSGKTSLKLTPWETSTASTLQWTSGIPLNSLRLDNQLSDNGFLVKFWLKSDGDVDVKLSYPNSSSTLTTANFEKTAQVGEWYLYEIKVTDAAGLATSIANTFTPIIYIIQSQERVSAGNWSNTDIYIDDVRMQPADAQANAYIYDPANFKILTQFDDQNFGLYYQYNDEGKLISKKIETEKGVKTVTEAGYNTPVKARE